MQCFFPAQAAGNALRKVLLNEGPYSNPAARLPFTWHRDISQVHDTELTLHFIKTMENLFISIFNCVFII